MMQKLKATLAAGLAAAVVLTSIGIGEADARSRRQRNNDAAAAGLMLGFLGAAAAIAAADSRRDRYYDDGYRYRGDGYRSHDYRNHGYRSDRRRVYRGERGYVGTDGIVRSDPSLQYNIPMDGR